MGTDRRLDFVIGEEKSLQQLLSSAEALMLLEGAIRAGATGASVEDDAGRTLAGCGSEEGQPVIRIITIEAEPVGRIRLWNQNTARLDGIADMLQNAIQTITNGAMKRLLTSEAHTTAVNLSYEELLEVNRQLSQSEQRYRELSKSLEIKVKERTKALEQAHATMLQREKMVSIGQLAAGMAHEINNPIGFILSNLKSLERYIARLLEMLDLYHKACETGLEGTGILATLNEKRQQLKLDFIIKDSPELLAQSVSGAERVSKIVADLKGFSHVDELSTGGIEVNRELLLTLSVLKPQIPPSATITTELAPQLPLATGEPTQLNQAFLAIIQNCLDLKLDQLQLLIKTELLTDSIRISFKDNGPGIPDQLQNRIFDPFFTTKDVGAGTGMGLTVAQQAVNACNGTITAYTLPDSGTEIVIQLPLRGATP